MVRLTLSGPGKNSLSTALMTHVIDELGRAEGAPVLITGEGDAFSAGLNLKEVAGLDRTGLIRFLELLERMVTALYRYPGPVAAAVNGHAIAGGCVITLCADYRVIMREPRLRIGLNEVALGLTFPPRTLAAVLSRLPAAHREVVLLGAELHGPDEAFGLGLVDALADDPVAEVSRWLELVGGYSREAYADTKLRGRESLDLPGGSWEKWLEGAGARWTSPALRATIARLLGA